MDAVVIYDIKGRQLFSSSSARDMREAVSEAFKQGVSLRNADLAGCDLCFLDLPGIDLQNADLRNADFFHSRLPYANLSGANLSGAKLKKTVLAGSRFSLLSSIEGASLDMTDIADTNIWFCKGAVVDTLCCACLTNSFLKEGRGARFGPLQSFIKVRNVEKLLRELNASACRVPKERTRLRIDLGKDWKGDLMVACLDLQIKCGRSRMLLAG